MCSPTTSSTIGKGVWGEDDFVATFIPSELELHDDYEALVKRGTLPKGSELARLVTKRLAWEIDLEYGLLANIGRTLPRTSSSAAGP